VPGLGRVLRRIALWQIPRDTADVRDSKDRTDPFQRRRIRVSLCLTCNRKLRIITGTQALIASLHEGPVTVVSVGQDLRPTAA
jgi:hypothetical protein